MEVKSVAALTHAKKNRSMDFLPGMVCNILCIHVHLYTCVAVSGKCSALGLYKCGSYSCIVMG